MSKAEGPYRSQIFLCPLPFGGKMCEGISQGEQILWLPEACFCPFWFIPFLLRWMQQSRPCRSQRSQK